MPAFKTKIVCIRETTSLISVYFFPQVRDDRDKILARCLRWTQIFDDFRGRNVDLIRACESRGLGSVTISCRFVHSRRRRRRDRRRRPS